MRDPMNWAVPLFRAFGVRVRLHLLYPLFAVSLIARILMPDGNVVTLLDAVLVVAVLPFAVILAHEFGHIFAGRSVGGDGEEILMWPLGGLAFVDTPREWKAHTVTAAGGPLVNVVICFAASVLLAAGGYLPAVNPVANPFVLDVTNYRDHGRLYTSEYVERYYKPNTAEVMTSLVVRPGEVSPLGKMSERLGGERALAPPWVTWTNRLFWVSWVLLLFNLLPAFPLDGGRILQGLVWWRSDYGRGTVVACFSGYVVGVLFLVLAFAFNESILVGLALYMLFQSWLALKRLEMDGGEFGYGGEYGGYAANADDDDEPKARPPRKPGAVRRWLQARAARLAAREQEVKAKDDERMDQLLAKINLHGRASLTAEEQAFMKRVSQRYRK